MNWQGERVLVTGGGSFIGSHLVEALVERGANVHVMDDFSSGKNEYLKGLVPYSTTDMHDQAMVEYVLRTGAYDTIFHLAADHGGRGYVDTHQVDCAYNLALDHMFIKLAVEFGVQRFCYASSGCVYPNYIQADANAELYLTEDMVGPPYDADNMYCWAKLMAEKTLKHVADAGLMDTSSCRYFTVYGPRGKVDHAIISFIARCRAQQDPYEVWGNGMQVRNWTYVDDIVEGTILAAERISDGTAVNLGTEERTTVRAAILMACHAANWWPTVVNFDEDAPTGPVNRVASNGLALDLLGWSPSVHIDDGIARTTRWFQETYTPEEAVKMLDHLMDR